jgi:hypothetical protein
LTFNDVSVVSRIANDRAGTDRFSQPGLPGPRQESFKLPISRVRRQNCSRESGDGGVDRAVWLVGKLTRPLRPSWNGVGTWRTATGEEISA